MITIIWTIACNTFSETIRNRVLYNILLFAMIIIGLSISFGEWSVFARVQVMADFGLATMSLSGLLLAIFIGVGMLGRELGSKTVYQMASKPIHRSAIVIGKFCGLCLTLVLNLMLMATFFFVNLLLIKGTLTVNYLAAVTLIGCEMVLIVAVALFFSTITTSTLAAIMTIAFYIAGHLNDLMDIGSIEKMNSSLSLLMKIIYYTIPNLEHLNIRAQAINALPLPPYYILYASGYSMLYTVLLLLCSSLIFSRKDL